MELSIVSVKLIVKGLGWLEILKSLLVRKSLKPLKDSSGTLLTNTLKASMATWLWHVTATPQDLTWHTLHQTSYWSSGRSFSNIGDFWWQLRISKYLGHLYFYRDQKWNPKRIVLGVLKILFQPPSNLFWINLDDSIINIYLWILLHFPSLFSTLMAN